MNKNLSLQKEFSQLSTKQQIQRGLKITKDLIAGIQGESAQIILPDDLQSFIVLNLEVSPFPTQSRKVMKYIETESLQKFADKKHFVKVDKYSIAFVNVEDLSYHNFENILNLDHLFNQAEFQITSKQLVESKNIQIFKMGGSTETLLSLDKLNYYNIPLNSEQRGGKRLIFHSNQLSMALTRMIAKSNFFDKKNFNHVNNVFRLNNFAPGDKKFKTHYDTPYADKQKNLFSKYTMLIYLTGSKNKKSKGQISPLTIEDFEIKSIEQNDCIIFDQKCEHEGNAYEESNKIFIRTELIYEMKDYEYDEKIARMFNMACYMTKEIDQQQYSADLFNDCVKMRNRIALDKTPEVCLVKQYEDTVFVTNGNDYWFNKKMDLKSIAVLIILDYFNGKMKGLNNVKIESKAFPKKQTKNKQESDDKSICNYLQQFELSDDQLNKLNTLKEYQNPSKFIPKELCEDFGIHWHVCDFSDLDGDFNGDGEPIYSKSVFKKEKQKAIKSLKRKLDETSVMIFDKEITISYDKIKIQFDSDEDNNKNGLQSGKINLSDFYINPGKQIHFAGGATVCQCQYEYHKNEVALYRTKRVYTFYLPNISFQYLPNGIKLSIDIFNNGFVYSSATSFKQPFTDENKANSLREKRDARQKQEYGSRYDFHVYQKSLTNYRHKFGNEESDDVSYQETDNENSCYYDHQDYLSECSFNEEEEEEEQLDSEDKESEEDETEEEQKIEEEEQQEDEDEIEGDNEQEEEEIEEEEQQEDEGEIDGDDEQEEEEEIQIKQKKKQIIKKIRKSSRKKNEKWRVHSYNLRSSTKLKRTKE